MTKRKLLLPGIKWKTSSLLSFLAAMMISFCAFSQTTYPMKGKVTDETDAGLPGASIVVKGTANGTVTDQDGNFTIEVSSDAVLSVSFIGYATQEIPVGGRTSI